MAARKKNPRSRPRQPLKRGVRVSKALDGYKAGEWVALNKAETRVLLSAKDPADLVRLVEAKGMHDKVVMMMVLDPNVSYVY